MGNPNIILNYAVALQERRFLGDVDSTSIIAKTMYVQIPRGHKN
jgi:hypothetical protein